MSGDFRSGGSPAGPGADPAGGPPGGGQRPAGSTSEPLTDASSESAEGGAEPQEPDAPTDREDGIARERDEYREALIRLQADFENYKKRMLKQQTEHLERAAASLVEKLLPVLDTADLALAHGGGEDVAQITSTLVGALEKEGLERIADEGTPFDPTLHDAVAHEPGESDGEQVVVEVLRAGYRWKGRVLRPAMVKVRG